MVAASPFPYPQGSQVLIAQLAAALHRRGHRVRLVSYHPGVGRVPDGIEVRRVPALPGVTTLKAGPSWEKPFLDLLLTRELLNMVRHGRPDLIHTHNFEGLLAALCVRRLTGLPVIHHIHNAMGLELHTYFRSTPGRWAGGVLGRWIDAHLPRRADYCIALSEQAVEFFQQRGVQQIRAVPPGIDFEPGDPARPRRVYGEEPLVLYSGNLDRYQDLGVLLRAFRLVADMRPDARLILSTNALPGQWRARAQALGIGEKTVFERTQDFGRVRDLLAAADVAVCPRSSCLGFPIKLLNYMAAGRAIVASEGSACGLGHLENGWVVENDNAQDMAAAIVALLDDPALACRLGERARHTARTEYTWNRAADGIEESYRQVARRTASMREARGRTS
jgi:glycosyltransferase involved in cell wall biosynthesis